MAAGMGMSAMKGVSEKGSEIAASLQSEGLRVVSVVGVVTLMVFCVLLTALSLYVWRKKTVSDDSSLSTNRMSSPSIHPSVHPHSILLVPVADKQATILNPNDANVLQCSTLGAPLFNNNNLLNNMMNNNDMPLNNNSNMLPNNNMLHNNHSHDPSFLPPTLPKALTYGTFPRNALFNIEQNNTNNNLNNNFNTNSNLNTNFNTNTSDNNFTTPHYPLLTPQPNKQPRFYRTGTSLGNHFCDNNVQHNNQQQQNITHQHNNNVDQFNPHYFNTLQHNSPHYFFPKPFLPSTPQQTTPLFSPQHFPSQKINFSNDLYQQTQQNPPPPSQPPLKPKLLQSFHTFNLKQQPHSTLPHKQHNTPQLHSTSQQHTLQHNTPNENTKQQNTPKNTPQQQQKPPQLHKTLPQKQQLSSSSSSSSFLKLKKPPLNKEGYDVSDLEIERYMCQNGGLQNNNKNNINKNSFETNNNNNNKNNNNNTNKNNKKNNKNPPLPKKHNFSNFDGYHSGDNVDDVIDEVIMTSS